MSAEGLKLPRSTSQINAEFLSSHIVIRNKFRQFAPESILMNCLSYLNAPPKSKEEEILRQPWIVMLLIKWVYQDELTEKEGRPPIDVKTADELRQLVHDLGSVARLPNEFEAVHFFMRAMAYQQFFYQTHDIGTKFSRDLLFFAQLDQNSKISKSFEEGVGLSLKDCVKMSFSLNAFFISPPTPLVIEVKDFGEILYAIPADTVTSFLNIISIGYLEMSKHFKSLREGSVEAEEFYEQSPFIQFPLIRDGNKYYCTHRMILFKCLQSFVYDHMRRVSSSDFMASFGQIFEAYVHEAIKITGLPVVTEEVLIDKLGDNGGIVDFVIEEKDALIFLDAKAIEMHDRGRVAYSSGLLRGKTKQVVKAISQAHSTFLKLLSSKDTSLDIDTTKEPFIVVVSYKELYLSGGRVFFDSVAEKDIKRLYKKFAPAQIPPENIFVLTVDEFDYLSQGVADGKVSLSSVLRGAREADKVAENMKFDFMLHLGTLGVKFRKPENLMHAFEAMFEPLIDEIKENKLDRPRLR